MSRSPIFVVGDVHGQYAKLTRNLQDASLIDQKLRWTGRDARLWFMGDFFDRGDDGVSAVDLVMRLQCEAEAVGGSANALLGNHEVLFLSVLTFGMEHGLDPFTYAWQRNGGNAQDKARITPAQAAWLRLRPALAREGEYLLMHADATFYTHYGETVDQVNRTIGRLLQGDDQRAWELLLDMFSERLTFRHERYDGTGRADHMLRQFGGNQIIHGHTPIHFMDEALLPQDIHEPFQYARGLCLDVDGGMYLGGQGFVYEMRP